MLVFQGVYPKGVLDWEIPKAVTGPIQRSMSFIIKKDETNIQMILI